jgi:hypothetical protein
MKNRYTLEVLKYDGRSHHIEIEADEIRIEEGVIKFMSGGGDRWIPIAVYPIDKTIISRILKLK